MTSNNNNTAVQGFKAIGLNNDLADLAASSTTRSKKAAMMSQQTSNQSVHLQQIPGHHRVQHQYQRGVFPQGKNGMPGQIFEAIQTSHRSTNRKRNIQQAFAGGANAANLSINSPKPGTGNLTNVRSKRTKQKQSLNQTHANGMIGQIDLGQPQIFSYEMAVNKGDRRRRTQETQQQNQQPYLNSQGRGVIVQHKIPTASIGKPNVHGGYGGNVIDFRSDDSMSYNSSNMPLTLGGFGLGGQPLMPSRLNQKPPNNNYNNQQVLEDPSLRESRLTNIVLDDFRKQVMGLEQQVAASSTGGDHSHLDQHNGHEKSNTAKGEHQESTDLDESRPVISMMQAKGGGSPDPNQKDTKNSSIKNGVNNSSNNNNNNPAVIVRKTSTSNHPVENYFLNEIAMSKQMKQQKKETLITDEQIDEMKRRIQRRQRGHGSEETSYMIKLDPSMVEEQNQQQQYQQAVDHMIGVQTGGGVSNSMMSGRYMQSTGKINSMRDRMDAQKFMQGQNQFMKNFVQNSKNSNMFNNFLGRCSQNKTQKAPVNKSQRQQQQSAGNGGQNLGKIIESQASQIGIDKNQNLRGVVKFNSGLDSDAGTQMLVGRSTPTSVTDLMKDETAARALSLNTLRQGGSLRLKDNETILGVIDSKLVSIQHQLVKKARDSVTITNEEVLGTEGVLTTEDDQGTPAHQINTPLTMPNMTSSIVTQKRESQQTSVSPTHFNNTLLRKQEPLVTNFTAINVQNTQIVQNLQSYPGNDNEQDRNQQQQFKLGSFVVRPSVNSSATTSPHLSNARLSTLQHSEDRLAIEVGGSLGQLSVDVVSPATKPRTIVPIHSTKAHESHLTDTRVRAPKDKMQLTRLPKKKNTLASLVSADQLPTVREDTNQDTKRSLKQQNNNGKKVNVQIKLLPCQEVCSCDGRQRHDRDCDLAPSESEQVMETINDRFHKYDIKFQLSRKQRQNKMYMRPGDYQSQGKNQKDARKFSNSMQLAPGQPCACNGLACCSLVPSERVLDCQCVVHSFKYQVNNRAQQLKRYAAADSYGEGTSNCDSLPNSRQTLLPARRMIHPRHRTVDKWTSDYIGTNTSKGSKTAIHSSRQARLSLTQMLANGQSLSQSRRRFPAQEQRILDGKLPAVTENFASAQQIQGARVTFIEQLKQNSRIDGARIDNSLYDSQSGQVHGRFAGPSQGNQAAVARDFKQILQDARKSAESSEQAGIRAVGSQERKQHLSVLSGSQENVQLPGSGDMQTQYLLTESTKEGNVTLSVKKQLRLQKMALQGIDYRPNKSQHKIFEAGDIKEYFKSHMERSQISSMRDSNNHQYLPEEATIFRSHDRSLSQGSQVKDSTQGPLSDHPSQKYLLLDSASRIKDTHAVTNGDEDPIQEDRVAIASQWNQIHTGGVSFRPERGPTGDRQQNYEFEPASPINSDDVRDLNLQHYSRETEEWVRHDEQKKLAASLWQIKKLTADPVMSIEQTKAKNNQAMIRKIQAKVENLNAYKKTAAQKLSERLAQQTGAVAVTESTLQEDSFFSRNSRGNYSRRAQNNLTASIQLQHQNDLSLDQKQHSIQQIFTNQTTLKNPQPYSPLDDEDFKRHTNGENPYVNRKAAEVFGKSSLFHPTPVPSAISAVAPQMQVTANDDDGDVSSPVSIFNNARGISKSLQSMKGSEDALVQQPCNEYEVNTNGSSSRDRVESVGIDGATKTLTLEDQRQIVDYSKVLPIAAGQDYEYNKLRGASIEVYRDDKQASLPSMRQVKSSASSSRSKQSRQQQPQSRGHSRQSKQSRQSRLSASDDVVSNKETERSLKHTNDEWSQLIGKNHPAPAAVKQ